MSDVQFTRQLATIISVDAVGFSRAIGRNADAAVRAFEERAAVIRETCRAHGGEIFGAAGDSFMAEFGLPAQALLAALAFQRRIVELNTGASEGARMAFRVGINTGDVIVRDANRYGDDVNIAARLQESAPESGIVISETTFNHIQRLSIARCSDMGEKRFKNILYPVRSYLVLSGTGARSLEPEAPVSPRADPSRFSGMPPGPPALAVLPFRAAGPGTDAEAMADGLADDIIIGLSNVRWLPVISRSSSFQFRNGAQAAIAGLALGARYVVSGTVSVAGPSIRVKAMLEDAVEASTIWAGTFDADVAGVPSIPDEIGGEIVVALAKEVDRVEQERSFRLPVESMDTWQLIRRGRWHMGRRTHDDTELALGFFERALDRSPNSTSALNELAWWYFWRSWLRFGAPHDYEADLVQVVAYARKALAIDPHDARPHCYLGIADIMRGRPGAALKHLDAALAINPSFSFAHSAKGSAHNLLGEATKAIPSHLQAEKLSPFDLYRFHNLGELAAAYAFVGDFEASAEAGKASLELSPAYWYSGLIRVGSLFRAGREAEAAADLTAFRLRHPGFRMRRAELVPYVDPALNRFLIGNFQAAEEKLAAPVQ
ncbi:MAG: adenylate/guanylate cyclase domain-containing protein [Mesorhizobium sp.]|nr:adenylate/guanylate cyclase domain-containing protein [Mesorhizobium sp.]MCO5160524.1 adenylate/guanylate cyclase domain-containing protein [Mesorhizobium sp.]